MNQNQQKQTSAALAPNHPITLPLNVVEAIGTLLGELPAKSSWRVLAEINRAVVAEIDKLAAEPAPAEPKKDAA